MPPIYSQDVRPLRVTTPLGPDALLLVGLSGSEAISRLFHFHLDALAENETDVPFDKLLGQKVVVELGLADQDVRYIAGICSRVGQAGRDQTFTAYHLEVVPQVWFLTRIAQSRIFQQLAVPEILAQVLKGLDVQFQITGRYEPRDYCVQYRETDFDFASRLMEEEGIFFFFRHSARGHTLVVADSPQSFPELPEPLIFDEAFSGGNREEERLGAWEKTQELRSGKVALWDHCFELPGKHLEATKTIQDTVAAGPVAHKLKLPGSDKLELYDYPGEYAQRFDGVDPSGGDRAGDVQKIFPDGQRTAGLRMQEEAAAALVIRGSGNVRALTSGSTFELAGHFDADGSYLLTKVEHAARMAVAYRTGDPDPYHYSSSFTCIPSALPFRPARATPRPVVQGSQTAVVVGPPGEEIFTDKYGRVKVQFHWDRQGQRNEKSSCWVRVGSIWAGKNWGAIHIPRIGQEVIVDFLEGDPDRPIIVGSVYNAEQMPPYALPANKTRSGIQSRSTLGGGPGNCNEIRFEDRKGSEQVLIHAEKNQDIEVENDETHWVGHDRRKTIDHDETTHVKRDRTETVDRNEAITIGVNRTEQVGKDETIAITGKRTETVGKGESVSIGEDQTVAIGGNAELTIGGNRTTSVGKSDQLDVGKALVINAGDSITLTAGLSTISLKKDGTIEIKGKDIKLQAMKGVKVESMGEIALEAMAKVGVTAAGMATLQAAVVKVN